MPRTTADNRVRAHDLVSATATRASEFRIRNEEPCSAPESIPLEDVEIVPRRMDVGADPMLYRVAFDPEGPLRVETTLEDMTRQVEERRFVQDPLYEIFVGPFSATEEHFEKLVANAADMDTTGKFAQALRLAKSTDNHLITRIVLVHALILQYMGLEEIGASHVLLEDNVVVATNGVCPKAYSELYKFVAVEQHGQKWISGQGEYASDVDATLYYRRLSMTYISARMPWNASFPVPTRRSA